MRDRPIPYCYWVASDLLAGEYPRNPDRESSLAKLGRLIGAGVTLFVDLTEEDESTPAGSPLQPYADLLRELAADRAHHRRFPIRDVSVPSDPDLVIRALDAIDAERVRGGLPYVHCLGGIGRTGTIVGCWLARHGHPGDSALRRLAELWAANPKSRHARSPESEAQERYVRNWREA
jgi:hypothetical protein